MIDLRHVRHFLAVVSHSTVQAAADALHLTQPALTKSLARFEDELGAKLFDRQGRRLVLDELGSGWSSAAQICFDTSASSKKRWRCGRVSARGRSRSASMRRRS